MMDYLLFFGVCIGVLFMFFIAGIMFSYVFSIASNILGFGFFRKKTAKIKEEILND